VGDFRLSSAPTARSRLDSFDRTIGLPDVDPEHLRLSSVKGVTRSKLPVSEFHLNFRTASSSASANPPPWSSATRGGGFANVEIRLEGDV